MPTMNPIKQTSILGDLFVPFSNLSPGEAFLGSAGVAAGGFGAVRLVADALHNMKRKEEAKKRTIQLDLPSPVEKVGETNYIPTKDELWTLGGAGLGAVTGLYGAKTLYDKYKKSENDKELAEANAKYMATLKSFKEKQSSVATPLFDSLCEGIVEMTKNAGVLSTLNALKYPLAVAGAGTAAASAAYSDYKHPENVIKQDVNSQLFHEQTPGVMTNAKNFLGVSVSAVALGTALAMWAAKKKKEEKAEKGQFPTNVAINYQ